MKALIALGANLGDPARTFEDAISQIERLIGFVLGRSSWYRTAPLPVPGDPAFVQPDYLNGAVLVETKFSPAEILHLLLEIEAALGRTRQPDLRWNPRIIDLDLILVDDRVVASENLTLPHPEMHRRDFVLKPLAQLWPEWRHPLLGKTAEEFLAELTFKTIKEGICRGTA